MSLQIILQFRVIEYVVKGSLTMERKVNTQIPDEDQAIEW